MTTTFDQLNSWFSQQAQTTGGPNLSYPTGGGITAPAPTLSSTTPGGIISKPPPSSTPTPGPTGSWVSAGTPEQVFGSQSQQANPGAPAALTAAAQQLQMESQQVVDPGTAATRGGGSDTPGLATTVNPGNQTPPGAQIGTAPQMPAPGLPPVTQLASYMSDTPMMGQPGWQPGQGTGPASIYYDPSTGRSLAQMGYSDDQARAMLQQMAASGQAIPYQTAGIAPGATPGPGDQHLNNPIGQAINAGWDQRNALNTAVNPYYNNFTGAPSAPNPGPSVQPGQLPRGYVPPRTGQQQAAGPRTGLEGALGGYGSGMGYGTGYGGNGLAGGSGTGATAGAGTYNYGNPYSSPGMYGYGSNGAQSAAYGTGAYTNGANNQALLYMLNRLNDARPRYQPRNPYGAMPQGLMSAILPFGNGGYSPYGGGYGQQGYGYGYGGGYGMERGYGYGQQSYGYGQPSYGGYGGGYGAPRYGGFAGGMNPMLAQALARYGGMR